jgi:hypothetical protein
MMEMIKWVQYYWRGEMWPPGGLGETNEEALEFKGCVFFLLIGEGDCWAIGVMKYSEKTCPSVTLSTTNPTWPDPGSNPGRRDGKPATNRLSYGAALKDVLLFLFALSVLSTVILLCSEENVRLSLLLSKAICIINLTLDGVSC